jgi:hypothetical protein
MYQILIEKKAIKELFHYVPSTHSKGQHYSRKIESYFGEKLRISIKNIIDIVVDEINIHID